MNAQREVVYKRRYHALFGDRLRVDIANMIYDTAEVIAESNKMAQDYKNFEFELIRFFSMASPISDKEFEKMDPLEIAGKVYKAAYQYIKKKRSAMAKLQIL